MNFAIILTSLEFLKGLVGFAQSVVTWSVGGESRPFRLIIDKISIDKISIDKIICSIPT